MKLTEAKLCCECEEIVEMRIDVCPSCTCTTFYYLSSLLSSVRLREEINIVRQMTRLFQL